MELCGIKTRFAKVHLFPVSFLKNLILLLNIVKNVIYCHVKIKDIPVFMKNSLKFPLELRGMETNVKKILILIQYKYNCQKAITFHI